MPLSKVVPRKKIFAVIIKQYSFEFHMKLFNQS